MSAMNDPELSVLMNRLTQLIEGNMYHTSPNPRVAAVVMKNNKIVSEGVHEGVGTDHAEIAALNQANSDVSGAEMLINLEPCTHKGRTPACVDAIIKSGIKKVIYTIKDPNPLVRETPAKSILEAHGIEVVEVEDHKDSYIWNDSFLKNMIKNQPLFHLKAAVSLDGKIAAQSGDSTYITNEECRQKVHQYRLIRDSIMVGLNTIQTDTPQLSVRLANHSKEYQPAIIVLDNKNNWDGNAPYTKNIKNRRLFIITDQDKYKVTKHNENETIIAVPLDKNGQFNLQDVGQLLYDEYSIKSILIEGGGRLFTSAIKQGIVDKCSIHVAPIFLGGDLGNSMIQQLDIMSLKEKIEVDISHVQVLNNNIAIDGYIHHPHSWYTHYFGGKNK